jgi:hypothetical protein
MERVEGFKKNNRSKITETFEFDKWPSLNIETGVTDSWRAAADRVLVEFEEIDRKAVADLFRKMADGLEGGDLQNAPKLNGARIQSWDDETGLNSVIIGDTTLNDLKVVNKPTGGFKPGEQVALVFDGKQWRIWGK